MCVSFFQVFTIISSYSVVGSRICWPLSHPPPSSGHSRYSNCVEANGKVEDRWSRKVCICSDLHWWSTTAYSASHHRSIGVSNFEIEDLKVLLASAKIKPVANQVSIATRARHSVSHPLAWSDFLPPLHLGSSSTPCQIRHRQRCCERSLQHSHVRHDSHIYILSVLIVWNFSPLTHQPGGPVDGPVNDIAARLNVKAEQVLLAWAKAKGVVVVT